MDMVSTLHEDAFAIRPVRIIRDTLREYEAVTFPDSPHVGVSLYLRRCRGQLLDDGRQCLLDILNEDGDIVQDYPITVRGFEYLRSALRFRWLRDSVMAK